MPPLSLWKGVGVRTKDFQFFDRIALNYIQIGGTQFYIHKYRGPSSAPETPDMDEAYLTISDVVNVEIRDRKYDPDIYSMKGHHLVSDTEFDLKQFGLFLSSDTMFITFHRNQMADILGRRLMSGDVIEVLHMRDTMTLDNKPINKFYVVEDGVSPAEGYSPTWWPHLWRVKCQPLTDSEEFQDILNQALEDRGDGIEPQLNPDGSVATLRDVNSTYNTEIAINDRVLTEAEAAVPFRNFQTAHFYVMQRDLDLDLHQENPAIDIFTGDGIPPNDSKPVPAGTTFPADNHVGDYFLRVDYLPPVLYRREKHKWKRVETNWRSPWLPAGRVLASFINNNNTTKLDDGSVVPEKQALRTSIKPRIDPDII